MNFRTMVFVFCFAGCGLQWYFVLAQDVPANSEASPVSNAPPKEASPKELRDGELAISGRYARFERLLSQMADVLGRQDPERADLLRRAIGKGREDQVKENIEKTIELLNKGELGTATEKQQEVVSSLETLLKLLQSEDRRSSVERERERLNGLLKDVRGVLAEQKSARAATQNSESPSNAAPGQQRAQDETEKLLESMKEHDNQDTQSEEQGDAPENESSEGRDEESKEGESKEGESKEGESPKDGKGSKQNKGDSKGKSSDGKSEKAPEDSQSPDSKEGKSKDEEGKKSKGHGTSSDGKEKSGKKSGQKSGNPKSEQKESRQTPGREELENAEQQMEKALEHLKEQEREKALENEDAAIEELHEAAARLEETLKQLREEEKEMMLASLEARFQRMLAAESQIREGTLTLAATPQKDWLDQYYGRCRELAQQQSELTLQCSQTVSLLREDGTSVAILLAVEDIEADMGSVSGWLQESKVGELTQSVQSDIIESLKQLIATTQKEMQEMKEQQQEQQQQKQSSEQKQGLVELMAEIRMLRNLQLQVNRRTRQVDGLLQKAATDDLPALQKQVRELSQRQDRLTQSAKELAKQAK